MKIIIVLVVVLLLGACSAEEYVLRSVNGEMGDTVRLTPKNNMFFLFRDGRWYLEQWSWGQEASVWSIRVPE